jgi:hypothetical protein
MAYSDFTLAKVKKAFNLDVEESQSYLMELQEFSLSLLLRDHYKVNL